MSRSRAANAGRAFRHVANDALTPDLVPDSLASWEAVTRFALTFDGYGFAGGFQECADIARNPDLRDLSQLRTALFFEQRRWRHFGEEPQGSGREHIFQLLGHIREIVETRRRNAPA